MSLEFDAWWNIKVGDMLDEYANDPSPQYLYNLARDSWNAGFDHGVDKAIERIYEPITCKEEDNASAQDTTNASIEE